MTVKRDDIQLEAIKAWAVNKKGTIILPTGTGKSYVGITIAAKQLQLQKIESVLVVVPTTNLIEQWKQEFNKWGYNPDHIDFYCLKSAYKLDKEVDLLIIDEIHTALAPKYRAVFEMIKYKQILGLTATIPANEEYVELLSKVCPIVYKKTIIDVVTILADFQVYNLSVPLNRRDRAKYQIFDANFKFAQSAIAKLKPKLGYGSTSIFDFANKYKDIKSDNELEVEAAKYGKAFWSAMSMRKFVCYNSITKLTKTVEIVNAIPGRRWILFNKTTKQADLLAEMLGDKAVVYHSKMKDEERERVLAEFNSNKELKYLVAADALNAGLNIPDLDAAISLSGVSTELDNVQRLGRILRFSPEKKAIFINLYSDNTIEKTWVEKRNKSIESSIWVTSLAQILNHEKSRWS